MVPDADRSRHEGAHLTVKLKSSAFRKNTAADAESVGRWCYIYEIKGRWRCMLIILEVFTSWTSSV
jgi:hypothetical protein